MTAYYNEIDPFAAQWLRELIKAGHIANGVVDERSIVDIRPADLAGYTQCHFFAGIGVWSYALRRAGWRDSTPVWTGSCPCQPFSAAGKGAGFDDERHLWPHFHYLIEQCQPAVVLGEQVASKDGLAWLDLVQADMEATRYAFGAVDTCAAGFGAPHIRQRLWWVGERLGNSERISAGRNPGTSLEAEGGIGLRAVGHDARSPSAVGRVGHHHHHHHHQGLEGQRSGHQAEGGWHGQVRPVAEAGELGRLADSYGDEQRQGRDAGAAAGEGLRFEPGGRGERCGLADCCCSGLEGRDARSMGRECAAIERNGGGELAHQPAAGPTNGLWRDADWLHCRDGKWRPVEPGTFPLAHGAAARVGRLRGYGNAINAEQAQGFIEAVMGR